MWKCPIWSTTIPILILYQPLISEYSVICLSYVIYSIFIVLDSKIPSCFFFCAVRVFFSRRVFPHSNRGTEDVIHCAHCKAHWGNVIGILSFMNNIDFDLTGLTKVAMLTWCSSLWSKLHLSGSQKENCIDRTTDKRKQCTANQISERALIPGHPLVISLTEISTSRVLRG